MALLKHLNNEKSAHAETSAMQYPASQPDHTSIIPGHLIHTIIRPALLLILLLFSSFSALAYGCKVDGIYYNLNNDDKTASVTYMYFYYSSSDNKDAYVGNIIIPESITYSETTYSVTSIGEWAFADCSGLTSVTIPNSVTSISNNAFFDCSGLTSVTIPNSVTSIGNGAFKDCSGLTSVTIPNSVTSIGEGAFFGCSGLTTMTIPNSVTSIGDLVFYGCSGLTSVTISNSVTSIGYGVFYGCTGLTTMTIPNSVTSIGDSAFSGCSSLTTVTIPNSVTSIGKYAFYNCSGLSSVTIPNSVTSIGYGAFGGCSGLTSVTVDKNNGTYDSRDNCNAIIETSTNKLIVGCKNTTIPNSVTSIGDRAFEGCSGLTSVTIGNSVTSIGDYAFTDCSGLTSVTIGNSVTSIGYDAFRGCSGLTKLVSLAVEPPICGRGAFEKVDKTTCQLLVPEESINKYKTADQWKEFLYILGYDGVDDVSVDSQNAVYEVYNLQGVRVGSGMREAEVTADALPHGVYILVSPQGRKKIQI